MNTVTANSWETYYIILLSALLSLSIPLGLFFISSILQRSKKKTVTNVTSSFLKSEPSDVAFPEKINTRFFLAINVAVILLGLSLALVPIVSVFRSVVESTDRQQLFRCILGILSLAFFLALGLFYASWKGDLGWLRSYDQKRPERSGENGPSQ